MENNDPKSQSFEIDIDDLDIDGINEFESFINKKTMPIKPENNVCLAVSASFILMFFIILLLVLLGLREFK